MSSTTRTTNDAGSGNDGRGGRGTPSRRTERRRIADIAIPDGRTAREEMVVDLAASISEVGLLHPVTITRDGVLLAGLHRLRAAERLGWAEIDVGIVDQDALRIELVGIDEDLIRKPLSALERAELLARRKWVYEVLYPDAARPGGGRHPKNVDLTPPFSLSTAGLVGRDQRTIQKDIQIARDISPDVRDAIRETKLADNQTELLKLARHDEQTQRNLAQKLADGSVRHLYEAERAVRLDEAQQRAASLPESADDCRLLTCSAADLIDEIEPGSVDLILTDPPYGLDALPAYGDLGRLAAHALAPDGLMLVMTGQMHLYEILTALREHLHISPWMLCYLVRSGGSPIVPTVQRRMNSWWKPILHCTRPGYAGAIHGDVIDVVEGGPKSKDLHDWQQDLPGMSRLVELFSLPGQLVVDPFLGTGTTGIAALRLGRRFMGCDVDADRILLSTARLSEAEPAQTN